jgi:hypothetical protein
MKPVLRIAAWLAVSACSSENITTLDSDPPTPPIVPGPGLPTPPIVPIAPGPGPLITLWGFVVDGNGGCVDSASVRIVHGQNLDQSATQETPCDAWSYSGGFLLSNILPGQELSIRAEAPGYESRVKTMTPLAGPQTTFSIALTRLP